VGSRKVLPSFQILDLEEEEWEEKDKKIPF
jgi:hypothetical protein